MVTTPNRSSNKNRVRISKSGQVTLPAHIRIKLGVELGQQVEFVEVQDGRFVVQPVRRVKPSELAGKFGPRPADIDVDDLIRESVHEGIERRQNRWSD
jgi:AbrB family looped-hinge helix DNA binding protein